MSIKEEMTLLTLSEAMKLSGMEGWSLTPKEEKFLIKSTTNLVNRNGKEWVIKHQARLRDEFEMISKETGLKIEPNQPTQEQSWTTEEFLRNDQLLDKGLRETYPHLYK